PASWYIGLKRPAASFVEQKDGLNTAVVAVSPDGTTVPGVKADVSLVQVQWTSVRRSEGNGFYAWESQRKETEVAHATVTTAGEPVPLSMALPAGGAFMLNVTARESDVRSSTTRMWFYALGTGYTAWARYDHNRIDV